MTARVGCLFARSFRLDLHARRGDYPRGEAVALLSKSVPPRVVGVSAEAREQGVTPEMTSRAARAQAPAIHFVTVDLDLYGEGSAEFIEAVRRVSPRVEPTGYGLVYFDLGGLSLIGSSEAELACSVVSELRAIGHNVAIGVAGSKFASRAAAVYLSSVEARVLVVQAGLERKMLATVPLDALPTTHTERESLASAGLKVLGDLDELGADLLEARFGKRGRWFFELARGEDPRPVLGKALDEPVTRAIDWEVGLESKEALLFAFKRVLDGALAEVGRSGLGVRSVVVVLQSGVGWRWQRELTVERPTLRTAAFLTRFRQASRTLSGRPTRLEVVVGGCAPFGPRQIGLFEVVRDDEDEVERLVASLEGICGRGKVGTTVLLDDWRPERSFARAAFDPKPVNAPPTVDPGGASKFCGFRLFEPPVPLTETLVHPGTTLSVPHWVGPRSRITDVEGPYNLATGWWEEGDGVDRAYFVVSTEQGERARLFQCRKTGQWYADGVYD